MCIPETAWIHCVALARLRPLNNVYHCLAGLFNYLATITDRAALCFMILKDARSLFTDMMCVRNKIKIFPP